MMLVTPDCYEAIRTTVAPLRAQTIQERIELLIAVPRGAELEAVPSELEGLFGPRVIAHINFVRLSTGARAQIFNGRVFSATRAWGGWCGPARRALFAVGAPFIPVVRLWRIVHIRRRREPQRRRLVRLLSTLLFGLTFDALGQALGYAFGAGAAKRRMAEFEFHRKRHLPDSERPITAPLAVGRA